MIRAADDQETAGTAQDRDANPVTISAGRF